jgi:hypothetical protein
VYGKSPCDYRAASAMSAVKQHESPLELQHERWTGNANALQ